MEKSDQPYLEHILEAIEKLEEYSTNASFQTFTESSLLQDGFIRQLMIIGEASNKLSSKLTMQYPEIPWVDIVGMRNKLVHEYFGVDLGAVWSVVEVDIPPLKQVVNSALALG